MATCCVINFGLDDSISNQVVSDPVESSNTSPALDFQPAHCSSVDIGVQW